MIDTDLENIFPIPESKLKLIEITNISEIKVENRNLKIMIVVLSCSILIYGVAQFLNNIKKDEKR
jgi:uncharacterized membrane protein YidH (DUF202 family)